MGINKKLKKKIKKDLNISCSVKYFLEFGFKAIEIATMSSAAFYIRYASLLYVYVFIIKSAVLGSWKRDSSAVSESLQL